MGEVTQDGYPPLVEVIVVDPDEVVPFGVIANPFPPTLDLSMSISGCPESI
jgi:hypothetical protein